MIDRLNEIKKKLQQLDELAVKGNVNAYLQVLEMLGGEVDAYNRRHSKTLQWQHNYPADHSKVNTYSSFPEYLRRQIEELDK